MSEPSPPGANRPGETIADYRIDVTRLMATVYNDTEQQIARADAKAGLVLTANSVLMAVSANVISTYLRNLSSFRGGLPVLICLFAALALSGLAIHYALRVAFPRVVNVNNLGLQLFNPGVTAKTPKDVYVERFLTLELDEMKRQIIESVHAKARVLDVKYGMVRRSIHSTIVAFVFWVAAMVLAAILV
jgi:Family of unknown function (DUF5706)